MLSECFNTAILVFNIAIWSLAFSNEAAGDLVKMQILVQWALKLYFFSPVPRVCCLSLDPPFTEQGVGVDKASVQQPAFSGKEPGVRTPILQMR